MKKLTILLLMISCILGGCTKGNNETNNENINDIFILLDQAAKDGKLGYDIGNSPGNLYEVNMNEITLIYHKWIQNDSTQNVMQMIYEDKNNGKHMKLFLSDMMDSSVDSLKVYYNDESVRGISLFSSAIDESTLDREDKALMLDIMNDIFIQLDIGKPEIYFKG